MAKKMTKVEREENETRTELYSEMQELGIVLAGAESMEYNMFV